MTIHLKSIITKLMIFALLPLMPVTALAGEIWEDKYYLPTVFLEAEYINATNTLGKSSNLTSLKGPAEVKAGDAFTITLFTGGDFPLLLNQEAAFFESYEGAAFQLIGISNLDNKGTAELEIEKDIAGEYKYRVEAGPIQNEVMVTVLPVSPSRIKGEKENFFLEVGKPAEVEFIVEDTYGNSLKASGKGQLKPETLLQVFVKDPYQNTVDEVGISSGPSGNFVAGFNADKTGDYEVEAFIKGTDISAKTIVSVREFGNLVGIELSTKDNDEPLLRISSSFEKRNRLELELMLVSEYGFKRTPSLQDDLNIIFTANFPNLAQVEETTMGRAVILERGKPGNVTVTATYLEKKKGLQDSIDVWIGAPPSQLYFNVITDGLTAKVETALLDRLNQPTFENTKGYTIATPSGIELVSKDEFERGKAGFILEAEEYGSYNISMITEDGISSSFMLTIEQAVKPASHVVIFVGEEHYFKDGEPVEMSHAPYISHGHVFVPAQFIADIFAVEVTYYTSPQKISFRGKDIEVVVDRVEQKLTAAKKGTAKTTPIGPLFLQRQDHTCFVPCVTIARILGAEVDFLPKSGMIEHITFIIKP